MFNLIGLGLDLGGISLEGFSALKKAEKVYLETYTVEFPYKQFKLVEILGKKVVPLTRIMVEKEEFLEEAKEKNIALLVYGSPLIATTHISLLLKCKELGIKYRVFHNSSIFDAISETGLQLYKFGKTASMPEWKKNFKPDSFIDLIKENKKIKAHTLLLIDIGLNFPDALKQFEKACKNKDFKIDHLIVCSQLGTEDQRIYYAGIRSLYGAEVFAPFCFIIPNKLHHIEEEALSKLSEKI